MSTPREGLAAFWSTSLAKVLVGEQPCLLEPWLKGHVTFEKRTRDQTSLTVWKANHTAQLHALVEQYRAEGWKCDVERFWKVTGQTAIISGKADLIAQKPDKRPRIIDVKSGQAKESDIAQVSLEMVLMPRSWNRPLMVFEGEVIYQHGVVVVTPEDAERLKPKLFALLKSLATMPRPAASPSESACRFCDVPESECAERWVGTEAVATTQDF